MRIFRVNPIGKPRMTQRDRWKKRPCVLAYFAYRDAIQAQAGNWKPAPVLGIGFHIEMPKSWSKLKRVEMAGLPHAQKPDIDNLIKAFLDCFGEDKQVHTVAASKLWTAEFGRVVVYD